MHTKNLKNRFSLFLLFLLFFTLQSFGQITGDISPKTITAGTGSVLTITGSGFGATRGLYSYVSFPRERSYDFTDVKVLPGDYLLWSDTKIQVRVPARAATGKPVIGVNNTDFYFLPELIIENQIAITSFSPTSIAAGTKSLLTINGTNFGNTPGSVHTRWSNTNETNITVGATEIISWTDTKIVVSVTESAGSGIVAVNVNGNWVYSATNLFVKYAVFGSPSAVPIVLINDNGIGGYTFQMETNFAANAAANATFRKAFESWKCSTNVNWTMGPTTSVNTETIDNTNVIKFGGSRDIVVGTLAYTAIHYQVCNNGELELADIDMTFNTDDYKWNFTSNSPRYDEYDFHTLALHELGHAHGLVHVNNTGDPMYFKTDPGTMRRSLSAEAIEGGRYMLLNSIQANGRTCSPTMTPLAAGGCILPIPTISSFTPTNGANGEVITINGTNFTEATEVRFGNSKASHFTIVSPTKITAYVGIGESGNVSVTTPGGIATASGFTYRLKTPQTMTYSPLPTKTYGDPDFEAIVSASSGLPFVFSSTNTTVATIVDNKIHIVGAGMTYITALQPGNSVYQPIGTTLTLVVNKASQIITFPAISSKLTTDADFDLIASSNVGLPISFVHSNPDVINITNSKAHILGPGTTRITAVQSGSLNYLPNSASIDLTVSNLPQILTFLDFPEKKVNDADFDLDASINTNLPITFTSSNTAVATIIGKKVHIVGAGTSIITASQAGNFAYAPISVEKTLTVTKLQSIVTLPNLAPKTYNDPDFDPGATANSGLSISYTSSNTSVATIVNNKVRIVGAGSTMITATQSGNSIYNSASSTTSLTVNKLQQNIIFPAIEPKKHNDADFELNATTNAGLPITYRSLNVAIATIIGNKVHIVAAGSVVITASQAGDANVNAATEVSQNLDISFDIPISNFTVKTTAITCKGNANGAINIIATQILSYTAVITLNGNSTTHQFNSTLALNNLAAGNYNVCVLVAGQPNYKQCFEVIITEPKDLSVFSSLKNEGNILTLKLDGSDTYKIELNGKTITTQKSEIELALNQGINQLKVTGSKICQGVFEKSFINGKEISIYPNPFKNVLNINTGRNETTPVKIEIFGIDSRLVHSGQYQPQSGVISINLSNLSKGLYMMKMSDGQNQTVFKIIKD